MGVIVCHAVAIQLKVFLSGPTVGICACFGFFFGCFGSMGAGGTNSASKRAARKVAASKRVASKVARSQRVASKVAPEVVPKKRVARKRPGGAGRCLEEPSEDPLALEEQQEQEQALKEQVDEAKGSGPPITEDGLRRKAASHSKYFATRLAWKVEWLGARPDRDKVTQVLAVIKRRKNASVVSNNLVWTGVYATLEFKKPVTAGNALAAARKILMLSLPAEEYKGKNVDIDFLDGQHPSEYGKPAAESAEAAAPKGEAVDDNEQEEGSLCVDADAAPSAGSTPHDGVASASHGVASASRGVATVSADVVGQRRLATNEFNDKATELRFKALFLIRFPQIPLWLPKSDVEHARGAHGVVVYAFEPNLRKDIAIKTLDSVKNLHFYEEMEALLVASAHPCCVQLLDVISMPSKKIGLVLNRLGANLHEVMVQSKKKGTETAPRPCWPLEHGRFEEAFGGLWSALAFLAERRLAHCDIKPANICFWKVGDEYQPAFREKGRGKLILCDFGSASLRTVDAGRAWDRQAIESRNGVEVTTMPYRAPELFFGMNDYGVAIDTWSLGVVQVESATNESLFGHLKTEDAFRRFFREKGDTRGNLDSLKALLFGPEEDWKVHDWDFIPNKAWRFLGGNGEPLLRGTLRLNPEKRLPPHEVAQLAFFSGRMEPHVWTGTGASAPDARLVASALPRTGPHETVIVGERGPCQVMIGHLSSAQVADILSDAYWKEDHERGWDVKGGTKRVKDRKFMRVEKAAANSTAPEHKDKTVKIQISGRSNTCEDPFDDRDQWNDMSLKDFNPATSVLAFIEAFKCANERVWPWIDEFFRSGPLKDFKDPKTVGANGTELLRVNSREWFGNCATIQFTRLFRHAENKHMDGGAAIVLLVVTLAGVRDLQFFPTDRDDELTLRNVPGMVYLTSVCGTDHQVSYDGNSRGFETPDLGEVGISIAYRTTLFRRSPYMHVRPGPELVWLEFNKMLRELHSRFVFKLPTREQYNKAFTDLLSKAVGAAR